MKKVMKIALLMASTWALSANGYASHNSLRDSMCMESNNNTKHAVKNSGYVKATPEYDAVFDHLADPKSTNRGLFSSTLPMKIDQSEYAIVKNQLNLGACTSFATCGAINALRVQKLAKNNPNLTIKQIKQALPLLSELYEYNKSLKLAGANDDDGVQLTVAIVAAKLGICIEKLMPYDDNTDGKNLFLQPASAACVQDAQNNKILDTNLRHERLKAGNINAMKQALYEGGLVVIGTEVFSEFESDSVAATGMVPMNSHSNSLGGHALLIDGYNDATQLVKFVNSWSDKWGDNGFGYLPYKYYEKYVGEAFKINNVSDVSAVDINMAATEKLSMLSSMKSRLSDPLHIENLFNIAKTYNADLKKVEEIRTRWHAVISDAEEIANGARQSVSGIKIVEQGIKEIVQGAEKLFKDIKVVI